MTSKKPFHYFTLKMNAENNKHENFKLKAQESF